MCAQVEVSFVTWFPQLIEYVYEGVYFNHVDAWYDFMILTLFLITIWIVLVKEIEYYNIILFYEYIHL